MCGTADVRWFLLLALATIVMFNVLMDKPSLDCGVRLSIVSQEEMRCWEAQLSGTPSLMSRLSVQGSGSVQQHQTGTPVAGSTPGASAVVSPQHGEHGSSQFTDGVGIVNNLALVQSPAMPPTSFPAGMALAPQNACTSGGVATTSQTSSFATVQVLSDGKSGLPDTFSPLLAQEFLDTQVNSTFLSGRHTFSAFCDAANLHGQNHVVIIGCTIMCRMAAACQWPGQMSAFSTLPCLTTTWCDQDCFPVHMRSFLLVFSLLFVEFAVTSFG
jgi:hypothetical protein